MSTRLICDLREPFDTLLDALNIRDARRVFSCLMDRALGEVLSAKLDQDDVLLEREAVLLDTSDDAGRPWHVAVPLAGASSAWVEAFNRSRAAAGLSPCSPATSRVTHLRVTVVHEQFE